MPKFTFSLMAPRSRRLPWASEDEVIPTRLPDSSRIAPPDEPEPMGAVNWKRATSPSHPFKPETLPVETLRSAPRRSISRSEEHTSELQSIMRISYAVFCLKKKKTKTHTVEF